mgnify:CR=1 FL=1
MAWTNINIEIDGVTYSGHRQNMFFSVPLVSGLEVGDSFKSDGVTYIADEVSDLHGRGETLTIKTTEVKNDKPKARRDGDKSRSTKVQSKSDDGRDS